MGNIHATPNLNNHSKVQVAGMYDSFQIWNMEDFEKYLTPDRKAKAEILVKKILVV